MKAVHAAIFILGGMSFLSPGHAQEKAKNVEPPASKLDTRGWLKFSTSPLEAGEMDRLVSSQFQKANQKPAPKTSDEQFIRRVYLDVTGRLPVPADVTDFLKDPSPDKRAKQIDKLLDSDEYATHWARYWREVITSRMTDRRGTLFSRHFESWLKTQLKENKSWAAITRDILTATGDLRNDTPEKNGQAFFLASRQGADAVTEIAAEASRIFLGIQIQCAQCHDHPSDVWKREQFHEFAAYFARTRSRPIREEKRIVGVALISAPFGEHSMPGKDDPKKTTLMRPKFLDGTSPRGLGSDGTRRRSLASAITSKDNPWFSAAYVNRLWGALMGQSFYQPIDDLGPEKEATMPDVLGRLAGAFRGSDYDIKKLFREILVSETYQRQIRPGEAPEDHLLFAANNPARLPADVLYHSLVGVLGALDGPNRPFGGFGGGGPFARFRGFEFQFTEEFSFDPSSKAEEIEGSISQALVLMNSPNINQKIRATGTNLLGRILTTYTDDNEALRVLYLRTLARRPTDRELTRCKQHIASAGGRGEAFEDILWALINSTEFQTRR